MKNCDYQRYLREKVLEMITSLWGKKSRFLGKEENKEINMVEYFKAKAREAWLLII